MIAWVGSKEGVRWLDCVGRVANFGWVYGGVKGVSGCLV